MTVAKAASLALLASAVATGAIMTGAITTGAGAAPPDPLARFQQIVVIYEENHSFDNLYGGWGEAGGMAVDGIDRAPSKARHQVRQDGSPFACLLQNDVNLASPPQKATCTDPAGFKSAFANGPFLIDRFIPADARTCAPPTKQAEHGVPRDSDGALPGGCTRDIVHRFYSEQYQLNGGAQNRYVTGSDAAGLPMGRYDTKQLPVYRYLHGKGAPHYVVADRFFQAAFGGSFLNHQWLVAAATPVFAGADNAGGADDLHSVLDGNAMPTATPLYKPTIAGVKDAALSASCTPPAGRPATPAGALCGDFAVNTIMPFFQPYPTGTADARRLPPLANPTIGDRLIAAGIDWAWYSGGWNDANGDIGAPGWTNGTEPGKCASPAAKPGAKWPNCPDALFQFHHQAFNYFKTFAPGTEARAKHLRDEVEFIAAARSGTLKQVSFVKPIGAENEHPGYASTPAGSAHLVELLKAVLDGPQGASTLVVVTYDEFGGQWDHVPPPGQGGTQSGTKGPHDAHGPGTRIPALLLSRAFTRSGVDHATYDTTSVMATIEQRFGLAPVATRDAASAPLRSAAALGLGGK